jgi:hypothetical protein
VSGIGGVVSKVTARAKVKLTLGVSVVYGMEIWVGNIGEGIECLLGVDFMTAAGVRLSLQDHSVHLPDEEPLPLVSDFQNLGRPKTIEIDVLEDHYLKPGEFVSVPVKFGSLNPRGTHLWALRGERWVTSIIYDAAKVPIAIKVVNVSDRTVGLWSRTTVGYLTEILTAERSICEARDSAVPGMTTVNLRVMSLT